VCFQSNLGEDLTRCAGTPAAKISAGSRRESWPETGFPAAKISTGNNLTEDLTGCLNNLIGNNLTEDLTEDLTGYLNNLIGNLTVC